MINDSIPVLSNTDKYNFPVMVNRDHTELQITAGYWEMCGVTGWSDRSNTKDYHFEDQHST